jgi:hypothetical protein
MNSKLVTIVMVGRAIIIPISDSPINLILSLN